MIQSHLNFFIFPMLNEIAAFKSWNHDHQGDVLQTTKVIKPTLTQIKAILEDQNRWNASLESTSKEIIARSMMLEMSFNHIAEYDYESLDDIIVGVNGIDDFEWVLESADTYAFTPIVGIFYKGRPVFLNKNYVKALGWENVEEIRNEVEQGVSLSRYTPESQEIAKQAVAKLKNGESYKNLILETRQGRVISWNSFGNPHALEIRIWHDITNGVFSNTEKQEENFIPQTSLQTNQLVMKYLWEVHRILPFSKDEVIKMMHFASLSELLDIVWNDGQLIMNASVEPQETGGSSQVIANSNYLHALGLTYDSFLQKVKDETLYNEHYDRETLLLIRWLWKTLKNEWYYFSDFPLKDSSGISKSYSWYRRLLEDKDFWIYRTFGIGNNAISDDERSLLDEK